MDWTRGCIDILRTTCQPQQKAHLQPRTLTLRKNLRARIFRRPHIAPKAQEHGILMYFASKLDAGEEAEDASATHWDVEARREKLMDALTG